MGPTLLASASPPGLLDRAWTGTILRGIYLETLEKLRRERGVPEVKPDFLKSAHNG